MINLIKAADCKKENASKQVYVVPCKERNEQFIEVVLLDARLLHVIMIFLSKKENGKKEKKTKKAHKEFLCGAEFLLFT